MARWFESLLALTLTLGVVTAGSKFAVSHSAILEKFHPKVKEFSTVLANKLDQSSADTQDIIHDTITKTLASQVDEFVAKTNGSNVEFCCSCKKCTNKCRRCGKSCCCKGSGGCSCKSCVSGILEQAVEMNVEYVESDKSPSSLDVWTVATTEMLVRELRAVVSAKVPSTNTKCCACTHCKQYTVGLCGMPACCTSGKLCVCKECAHTEGILQMASVENFVALTSEAEGQVQEVRHLVDQLVTLISLL